MRAPLVAVVVAIGLALSAAGGAVPIPRGLGSALRVVVENVDPGDPTPERAVHELEAMTSARRDDPMSCLHRIACTCEPNPSRRYPTVLFASRSDGS